MGINFRGKRGQSAVEYILLVASLVGLFFAFRQELNAAFSRIIDKRVASPATQEAWRGGEKRMEDYYVGGNKTVQAGD